MSKYRLTQEAAERLEEIWLYTAETWGSEQADTYLDKLEAGCIRIAEGRAASYSCHRFNPNIAVDVFYYVVESHFVVFREADDGVVDILTVIHGVSNKQLSEFLDRLN